MRLGLYIVRPDFLLQLHERWKRADDENVVDELLASCALKPLETLRVGMCGISEPKAKRKAIDTLREMGADVVFPLTFDTDVTHLFCGVTSRQQSSTLNTVYQLRKNYIGTAGERRGAKIMHCVLYEYLEDCRRAGGLLDAKDQEKYDIWRRSGKRITGDERNLILSTYPDRSPKAMEQRIHNIMLATAAKVRPEVWLPAVAARPLAQMPAPSRGANLKSALTGVKPRQESKNAPTDDPDPGALIGVKTSLLAMPRKVIHGQTARRNEAPMLFNPISVRNQVGDTATAKGKCPSGSVPEDEQVPPSSETPLQDTAVRLDMARKDSSRQLLIKSALLGAGAVVLDADDRSKRAKYCILSESIASPAVSTDHSIHWDGRGEPVTYFWLEQCLFYGRVIDPSALPSGSQPYLRPPVIDLPLDAAKSAVIALTGFISDDSTPERTQLTKALEAVGFKVTDTFAKRINTHLLSNRTLSREEQELSAQEMQRRGWLKESKAKEWSIPVIGVDWLDAIWSRGIVGELKRTISLRSQPAPHLHVGNESVQSLNETQTVVPPALEGPAADPHDASDESWKIAVGLEKTISEGPGDPPVAQAAPQPAIQPQDQKELTPAPAESFFCGTSMYTARLGQDLTALFLGSKQRGEVGGPGANGTDAARRVGHGTDDARPVRSGSGAHGTTKLSGKLPPKSRRSAAAAAMRNGSPVVVGRSASVGTWRDSSVSVSPAKKDAAETEAMLSYADADVEGVRGVGKETLSEAARILALQREAEVRRTSGDGRDAGRALPTNSLMDNRDVHQHQVLAPLATQSFQQRGSMDDSEDEGAWPRRNGETTSIKITYCDPQSEKERRRLEELLSASMVTDSALDESTDPENGIPGKRPHPPLPLPQPEPEAGSRASKRGREEGADGGQRGDYQLAREHTDKASAAPPQKKIQARRQPGTRR